MHNNSDSIFEDEIDPFEELLGYHPRWYQREFEEALLKGGKRRAFLLFHRRSGKDFCCWLFMIYCALVDSPGTYFYILPNYRQGKKVIWDNIDESGKRMIDYVPKALLAAKPNDTEMKLKLANGSIIQVVGSDNPDSIRGTNPKGVVFSEYAFQAPNIWFEVISPILSRNGGWAIFNTTPLGRNHAYDLWNAVQDSSHWYTKKLTIDDTGLISKEMIDQEVAEGKSEETIRQEYFCDFNRGIDGTFYGRIIQKARDDKRIGYVPYDITEPVITAWDLGYGDSTAIVFAQARGSAGVRIIDYYENQGESIEHYIKILQSKGYNYSKHFMPHDVAKGSLETGRSLSHSLTSLGLKHVTLANLPLSYGIEKTRAMLNTIWIDEKKGKEIIRHLEFYHKQFNEKLACYSDTPVHDSSSHGCDAMRYLALGLEQSGSDIVGSLSPQKHADFREKYYGIKRP